MNMMSVDNQAIKAHAQNNVSKLPIACTPAENLRRELFKLFHTYS